MSSIDEISFKEIFSNDENGEFYIEILILTKKLINHNEAEDISQDWAVAGSNVLFHAVLETAEIVD